MNREDNPQEWLRAAEDDRRVAKNLLEDGEFAACAFHCQQAVEKLLKAVIVKQTNQRPPHMHELRVLLEKITGFEISTELAQSVARIDSYYVGSRYPLDVVDPGVFIRPLAESAVQKTDEVFEWFLKRINFDNK